MSRRVPHSGHGPGWPNEPEEGQGYGYDGDGRGAAGPEQGHYGQYDPPAYGAPGGNGQPPVRGPRYPNGGQRYTNGDQRYPNGGQGGNGYGPTGYDQRNYPADSVTPGQGPGSQPTQTFNYQGPGSSYLGNGYQGNGYQGNGAQRNGAQGSGGQGGYGYNGENRRRPNGNMRRYADPRYQDQGQDDVRYAASGQGPSGTAPTTEQPSLSGRRWHAPRFRRTRRLFRLRSVRVVSAVVGLFLVWVLFSAGQAAFKNNGQGLSTNLAEWARDHYLGPVVTFGEWVSYNPPPKGGRPSFSLAVPSGEAVSPGKAARVKAKSAFAADIPATLKSLAGSSIAGEGQWRVVEKVRGEPAILATFLRDATYTSQVNGIASIDQRLVRFSLRPGTEDPGTGQDWGVPAYIPAGQRAGLLATFNGGFKLDSAGGGFYLNGIYHGSLQSGAASVVYYKNGTVKIGEWGRDFTMSPSVAGVRQNLRLLVDHGQVSSSANSDVMTNWGATLGGGYYVWRSGIGITRDGRVVYVYGSALNAQDLGLLLQRAGAVEGMQLDINPAWMKFDYYQGSASDPTPRPLLPTQQPSPYSYYTPSTRDFTAVYAR